MAESTGLDLTLLTALVKHWRLALITTVVLGGLAFGVLLLTATSSHTAEASMLLESPRESSLFQSNQAASQPASAYIADQVDILGTPEMARRSVIEARKEDPDFPYGTVELLSRITISQPGDQALVRIGFTAARSEDAVLGANSVVAAYQAFLSSESSEMFAEYIDALDLELANLQDDIAEMQDLIDAADSEGERTVRRQELGQLIRRAGAIAEQRDTLEVDARLLGRGVRLITPAVVSEGSSVTSMRSLMGVAFVALFGGVGITYAYAVRHRTITTAADAGQALGVPVLGVVPEHDVFMQVNFDMQRHYRFIVDVAGEWREDGDDPRRAVVIGVISARPGAGVTLSVASLGSVLAWRDVRTLAIDADYEYRELTRILAPDTKLDRPGIADIVDGTTTPGAAAISVSRSYGSMNLISRGARPLHGEDAPHLPRVIDQVSDDVDVVLIDVPSGLNSPLNEAAVASVDRLIVVVEYDARVIDVERLGDELVERDLMCDGVVFNRVPTRAGRRRRALRSQPSRRVEHVTG